MSNDSSFLEAVRTAQQRPTPLCGVGKALAGLTDADRRGLVTALGDNSIFGTSIEKALRQRGFAIGKDGVQRHRRGLCSCPK